MEDSDADCRLIPCAGDGDRDYGPGPIFLKKWVKGFQKERFGARNSLREFRLKTEMAIEIEFASQDMVIAREVDGRARNAERET